jgi:hypothetical protein
MKRLVALVAVTALVSGCWNVRRGTAEVANDFDAQGVRVIAVLPVLNQTETQMAPWSAYAGLSRALTREKKFELVPQSKVITTLNRGGGGAVWAQAMNRVNMGQEISDAQLGAIAAALEADALFLETVLAFHQTEEQGVGVSASGGTYAKQFPVSVVRVRGMLWGAGAKRVLWRDEAQTRYYSDTIKEHTANIQTVVTMATRELLANFPENTWAPVEPPSPTPVPAPVTSYAPFPTPADPLERR